MIDAAIRYGVSVLPVVAFLISLILLDSYKLIRFRSVATAVIFGFGAGIASFAIGTLVLARGGIAPDSYARWVAPPLEESLKLCYVAWLIRGKRIGFMVDAAIYGFAIGAGFAILENVYYLRALATPNVLLWIVRGFGTAVMHGGTTALAGIIALGFIERERARGFAALIPGLALATLIHSLYNYGLLDPVLSALCVVVVLPLVMMLVFYRSERGLKDWLGIGFDSDSQLLEMITTGMIAETRIGRYLLSLKTRFPGEAVADMLCLVRLHVELALKAKGILLMREAGFDVKPDSEVREKFDEMRYLEKSIGRTGLLAIEPVLHWSSRDLWQLHILGKK
jgi:RsiW-degrading membrane proteinase PrsW (M82 family)